MRKQERRAWICLLLVLVLLAGICVIPAALLLAGGAPVYLMPGIFAVFAGTAGLVSTVRDSRSRRTEENWANACEFRKKSVILHRFFPQG